MATTEVPQTPSRKTEKERPRLTEEEKQQLLANLDIEVRDRERQFRETLAHVLENFRNHHEGRVLRIPKLVRGITMGEFADKYNGDINACLRGLQRERQGGEPTLDLELKKRKWKDTNDAPGPEDAESSRANKSARIQSPVKSPVKMDAARIIKARLQKTPATLRTLRHPYPNLGPSSPFKSPSRPMSRFMSPTKASAARISSTASSSRLPSSNFNPLLPKTPAYPRAPRKNESLLSINGSPLAFPARERHKDGDVGIPGTIDEEDEGPMLRRSQSIIIRKGPAFSQSTNDGGGTLRSRSPSRAAHSSSGSSTSTSSIPSSTDSVALSRPSALIRVPTKDGLVLEFDPLLTTPAELDALEGITNSAKKQAKEDMTRLVETALARWRI